MTFDEIALEDLRKRLTDHLEAAYFGGIEPAVIEILDVQKAGEAELLALARKWGVTP